jgi:alkyl sulfatase BDS1-like metallo-beta-lactamase superfamily hydrolase
MATIEECRAALEELAARAERNKDRVRKAASQTRSLSCTVPDLGVTFNGTLRDGGLYDITSEPTEGKAQIRLTVKSDNLIELIGGRLPITSAVTHGKLKVSATPLDLLRLKGIFS